MANPDRPNGLIWVKDLAGVYGAPPIMTAALATTNEPLAYGDSISLVAAGSVDRTVTDGSEVHDEQTLVGVCQWIKYKDSSGNLIQSRYVGAAQGDDTRTLGSGTGAIVGYIPYAPTFVWSVQCDDGGAVAISETLIGNAATLVALAATDPTQQGQSGHSIMELDTSSAGSGADPFSIIDLDRKPGMVFSSTEADSRFGRVLVVCRGAMIPASTPVTDGV